MLAAFVYFVLPAILLTLGLPIFVVLILTSLAAILLIAHAPLQAIQTYMFGSLDNFPLLAVPFFVLAGEIMGRGGIANRVVTWVVSIIGGVRGSLAVTTVASSELFGAMAHSRRPRSSFSRRFYYLSWKRRASTRCTLESSWR